MENKMTPELIAQYAHEMNRRWCECCGDYSMTSWTSAPEWQRTSSINGVMFHLANPDASPSASHDNWYAEKLADGWKYGEVKDPIAKTHPCMVSFDELPPQQQFKDRLFKLVVDTFRGET